jgi:uncharacterized protein YdeI (YjbR/CyaY-like superfamily)
VSAGPHGYDVLDVRDRSEWRAWLEAHHASARGVWVVSPRKRADRVGLDYDALVEEALCFGWVDSKSRSVDDERTSLYFAPRKPKSAWSESNVARVERLEAAGLMTAAGRHAVEQAKRLGMWPS